MAAPATLPERFRTSRTFAAKLGGLSDEWLGEMGRWLHLHRAAMSPMAGGEEGAEQAFYGLRLDDICPMLPKLRAAIAAVAPQVVEAMGAPGDWQVGDRIDAVLHHNGHATPWWQVEAGSPWISWEIVLHSDPKMWTGGELTFSDGKTVEPQHGHAVFFDPTIRHKVGRVECWSAMAIHGRWSLCGHILNRPPAVADESKPADPPTACDDAD